MANPRVGVSMVGLADPRTTGLERYGIELVEALRAHSNWEIVPFVHRWAADRLGGPCVVVPQGLTRPLALEAWLPLAARRANIELMHCTGYAVPPHVGVPTILTVQDLISWELPDTITRGNRLYFRPLMERAIRSRDLKAILATTRATADSIAERFHTQVPVAVANIGIGEWWFEGERRATRSPLRLLTVGTLEPRKGMERVIRACEILDGAGVKYEWHVVGRNGWGDVELPTQVKQLGRVDDDRLRAEYGAAHLLVSASTQEGFNLPALEALAGGAHLALSDIPVHRELYTGVAEFFSLADVSALGQTLVRFASSRTGDSTLSRAHARGYSWRRCIDTVSSVWSASLPD